MALSADAQLAPAIMHLIQLSQAVLAQWSASTLSCSFSMCASLQHGSYARMVPAAMLLPDLL